MKKLVYILFTFVILFSACNPNEDIYDELDDLKGDYKGFIESYVLTSDDYSTASSAAKKDAVSVGDLDSTYAKLIKSMEAFNNYYPAEDYVGSVLAKEFPEYGKNSIALVTYNYVQDLPEELASYSNLDSYVFDDNGYDQVDSLVNFAGYFYPDFDPNIYLQSVLPDLIPGAQNGDIYRINYLYADANPIFPESLVKKLDEGFDTDFGAFDTTNVEGAKSWYISSYGDDTYAKISGYQQVNEDWLIANDITLGNEESIILGFTHAIKYLNSQWDQISVLISENFDGTNIAAATWDTLKWGDDIDISGATLGSSYDFYYSGDIDMVEYAGKTIDIAFKYTSTLDNAATWEIADVSVIEGEKIVGVEAKEFNDVYTLSAGNWTKIESVYYLSASDYEAMGDPGIDNYFSADILPQDYLPNFLSAKYPEAGPGVVKTIIYQYDSDLDGEITLATKYTYGDEGWESAYDYITEATNQFVHNGEEWKFDPTITVEMGSTEYQIIVAYVRDNISADLLDSYGTFESYYGAGSYYKNFDINAYDKEEFGDGENDWQNAIEEAIGLRLLPVLFPDAELQANGVDMYYRVVFQTFKSGTKTNYAVKFQVTKAGPDPEFTYDETYGFQEVK